jgi:hypothetical protein
MDTNWQIMNDNVLYFNEWVKQNESWQGKLQIVGNNLVYQNSKTQEVIDISHYYLPQILENLLLQEQIQIKNKLQAEDIFRIIRVNVLADEEKEASVFKDDVWITNLLMKQDEMGQFFLVVEDNQGHKFKITQNIELVLQIYQKLHQKNAMIPFQEFKEEMEKIKHE